MRHTASNGATLRPRRERLTQATFRHFWAFWSHSFIHFFIANKCQNAFAVTYMTKTYYDYVGK